MSGMNMDALLGAHQRTQENSGISFGDIDKFVIRNGAVVRLIGSMASAWEHFVQTPKGQRPVYCAGPESDCKICSICASWAMSEDTELQEAAKNMKAKEKFYFNVLDRSEQGRKWHAEKKKSMLLVQNDKGMNVGSMVLQAIGNICQMLKEQGKDPDPNGFDISLVKTGSGMQTKYGAQFTGDTTPLTEEEKAYELWNLSDLTKPTSQQDVDAIAAFLKGDNSDVAGGQSGFKTESINYDPTQAAKESMGSVPQGNQGGNAAAPAAAPPPATPPATAPAPAAPPNAKPETPAQPAYADTKPTDNYDPKEFYQVPCGECGAMMQISLIDKRDLQCHGCKKVYRSPNT